ncbi:hypothetical protein FA15DRAFT_658058 [Coprinopsis marcescibilis]|uniref:Uncharacterized protein n=1 Tax=Coprinopsis marcescibilis TaxID=230819 RepID=A0A5C3KMQ0_COPMA|nr:hypothetical protein FA15DRAFT_658058 [Coprinopsis marcescibilis]
MFRLYGTETAHHAARAKLMIDKHNTQQTSSFSLQYYHLDRAESCLKIESRQVKCTRINMRRGRPCRWSYHPASELARVLRWAAGAFCESELFEEAEWLLAAGFGGTESGRRGKTRVGCVMRRYGYWNVALMVDTGERSLGGSVEVRNKHAQVSCAAQNHHLGTKSKKPALQWLRMK